MDIETLKTTNDSWFVVLLFGCAIFALVLACLFEIYMRKRRFKKWKAR